MPADGDFGAALGAARLAMIADGAGITDVCRKPAIEGTIDPDPALADALLPACGRWREIYRLLPRRPQISLPADVICPACLRHSGPRRGVNCGDKFQ